MVAVIMDVVLIVVIMAVTGVRFLVSVVFVDRGVRVVLRHCLAMGVGINVLIATGLVGTDRVPVVSGVVTVRGWGGHDTPSLAEMVGGAVRTPDSGWRAQVLRRR